MSYEDAAKVKYALLFLAMLRLCRPFIYFSFAFSYISYISVYFATNIYNKLLYKLRIFISSFPLSLLLINHLPEQLYLRRPGPATPSH